MIKAKIKNHAFMEIYRWLIIACGFAVLALTSFQLFTQKIESDFFLLLAFTAFVATRINIKFPRFNGTITVSDAFIFLALLLWGAPAAILTAVVDSIASTIRLKSRLVRTYLFNICSSACVTWLTASVLNIFYGNPTEISKNLSLNSFILAMCLIALAQYLGSMGINSIMQALKLGTDLWKTWSTYFLWSCVTFIVGAALAGLIVKLLSSVGFIAVLLVSPVIFLVYLTYKSYLKSHNAMQESEARFRSSFNYATVGMALVSPEGKWTQVNQSLQNILGLREEDFLSTYYQDILSPSDLPEVIKKTQSLLDDKTPAFQTEVRFLNKDRKEVWGALGVSTARDLQGNLRHFIFQVQDVTLRKKAEEKLRHDALHDALTGLPNRKALLANLKKALTNSSDKKDNLLATLFLDLDGFKIVNDSLGHNVGDELLQVIARRLLECVRTHDTVARLGGDEFTILLEKVHDISQVIVVAERIRDSISKPITLQGHEISLNASIGIATTELRYSSPNEMLRDADAAMYQAKARGKGCYVIFDENMYANATRNLRLANDLRKAIEQNELELFYQAVKSLETNEVSRFEALMRWNHPKFGLLAPPDFIPIAEENGLITKLDNWGMAEACRQLREWQIANPELEDFVISVNASNKQFAQVDFIESVRKILKDTGLQPKCLQLEITESAMAKNLHNTVDVLKDLNSIGVKVALDDFGTGYSSLNYLHELPITTLKIDRSFITRMNCETNGAEIVKTIISLARNLKMEVVAEGVETNEQLEKLREIGCDLGQGYLFSRPIAADKAIKLVIESNLTVIPTPSRENPNKLRLIS